MILTKIWKHGTWMGGYNIGDGEEDENMDPTYTSMHNTSG
jgi:hypothetical protein